MMQPVHTIIKSGTDADGRMMFTCTCGALSSRHHPDKIHEMSRAHQARMK